MCVYVYNLYSVFCTVGIYWYCYILIKPIILVADYLKYFMVLYLEYTIFIKAILFSHRVWEHFITYFYAVSMVPSYSIYTILIVSILFNIRVQGFDNLLLALIKRPANINFALYIIWCVKCTYLIYKVVSMEFFENCKCVIL